MKQIIENVDLRPHNSFGLPSIAQKYLMVERLEDINGLEEVSELFVLGGGSNILLPGRIDRLVVHNKLDYLHVDGKTKGVVDVRVGAGMNWHRFVTVCVEMGWYGLENLALIPGNAGAAPIQNIGAYGVEQKQAFVSLRAYDLKSGEYIQFNKEQCEFGYRDSIFKRGAKDRYLITDVFYRLSTENDYEPNIRYESLKHDLDKKRIRHPSVLDVFNSVVEVRKSKLPSPGELGNSGSFFKNPVVDSNKFEQLIKSWPQLKYYNLNNGYYKIPAGYLIESCGWKGKRIGNTGCYEKQALVIVNYGNATSEEVVEFVGRVKESVTEKYGIELEEEVNIVKS